MSIKTHFWPALFLLLIVLSGCSTQETIQNSTSPRIKSMVTVLSPNQRKKHTIGDSILFDFKSKSDASIDSISIESNGKTIYHGNSAKKLLIPTSKSSAGIKNWLVTLYLSTGKVEKKGINTTLLSNIEPDQYSYRIITEYPHEKEAFTQGLQIDNGILYESTGQKGNSSIRIVDLQSGKIQLKSDIDAQFFGEGISTYKDEIFMLTWHSGKGFVFDKAALTLVREINYPTQGWGLTTKDDTLIMSDGTENLYFMEPEGFTEVKKIEVYDNTGKIDNLNELEYINGYIYANRWMTNKIYIINPENGIVTGIIDLTGIINKNEYNYEMDVLNGIAHDNKQDKVYITGKYWPKLFEIEIIKKPNNS